MQVKRIVTIVLGLAAAAWLSLWLPELFRPPRAGPDLAPIAFETTARPVQANDASSDPPSQSATDPHQVDSVAAQAPLVLDALVDTSEPWGRSFEECRTKNRVKISVCKHRFEPRDERWAREAEQRIRNYVADTGLLRMPDEEDTQYRLECRTTFCQVRLYVDRAGLSDHLRSIGRYNESLAREHEFAHLTLAHTGRPDGAWGGRWSDDRAEELRLALVLGGLLEADSSVAVSVFEPAYREQDSFLEFELSRCPDINDLCVL